MSKKARAPRPGAGRREAETTHAATLLRITIRGEARTLAAGNIPIKERLICRKATGFGVEQFLDSDTFGLDSLMVLWWLAGRAAGDPFLTLEKASEVFDGVTAEDIDVTEVTPADDNPGEGDDPEG